MKRYLLFLFLIIIPIVYAGQINNIYYNSVGGTSINYDNNGNLIPKLAVLDETDSGLDIDALRIVARGINVLRRPDRAVLMVTHYQRLLSHVVPDRVHVLSEGRIVRSGGKDLALELEEKGYGWLEGTGMESGT